MGIFVSLFLTWVIEQISVRVLNDTNMSKIGHPRDQLVARVNLDVQWKGHGTKVKMMIEFKEARISSRKTVMHESCSYIDQQVAYRSFELKTVAYLPDDPRASVKLCGLGVERSSTILSLAPQKLKVKCTHKE